MLAERRADAREEHGEPEGLGHVVVGARLEPQDLVGVRILRRQHDDRALEAVAAQNLDRLATVHVGETNVEQHQVDMAVAHLGERFAARPCFGEIEFPVVGQLVAQRLPEVGIVIDYEDAALVH